MTATCAVLYSACPASARSLRARRDADDRTAAAMSSISAMDRA
jgi:hypothetical protein